MTTWKYIFTSSKGSRFNYRKVDDQITPDFIHETREKLEMSSRLFSAILGISSQRVEDWESGKSVPTAMENRLLYLLHQHPELADELYVYEDAATGQEIESPEIN